MCTGYIQQYEQELPRSENSCSTPAQTSEYHKLWAKISIRTLQQEILIQTDRESLVY